MISDSQTFLWPFQWGQFSGTHCSTYLHWLLTCVLVPCIILSSIKCQYQMQKVLKTIQGGCTYSLCRSAFTSRTTYDLRCLFQNKFLQRKQVMSSMEPYKIEFSSFLRITLEQSCREYVPCSLWVEHMLISHIREHPIPMVYSKGPKRREGFLYNLLLQTGKIKPA